MKPESQWMIVSALLFGSAVFSIPAIMAASVGEYLGVHRAASAFSTVTIFFAAGQTVGPTIAGIIGKTTGSFTGAYLLAALLIGSAMVFALFLPRPATSATEP
jgi:MFS family permease